jgi:hypothetical protein
VSGPLASLLDVAERAITVADLATTELWYIEPEWSAARTADGLRTRSFDAAPLRSDPIRRYMTLAAAEAGEGSALELSRPIDVELVVSGALPLTDAVAALTHQPFLFVLERDRVNGMVTRADLQRLPVSMVALGLIIAGEAALDMLIARFTNMEWLSLLSPERQEGIQVVFNDRRKRNAEITLLQCLNLDDRMTIASKLDRLRVELGHSSRTSFKTWAEPIKDLRNALAHGDGLLDAEPDPVAAAGLFQSAREFAERAWRVVEESEQMWDAFLQTSIALDGPAGRVVLAGENAVADLPMPPPLHVLTGWNPSARPRSVAENERCNQQLGERLQAAGSAPEVALCWLGSWSEPSFVVSGFSIAGAIQLAREFGQAAIFELTHGELRVIDCTNGQMRGQRARSVRSPSSTRQEHDA